jgi:hypothetical protein
MDRLAVSHPHPLVAVALLALAVMLWPKSADGATVPLRGKVIGDANSVVTMKVVTRRGVPVRVKQIVFRRVDHSCTGGTVRELTVRHPGTRILKIGITSRFTFFDLRTWPSGLPAPNNLNSVAITGKPPRGLGRVRGTIDSTVRFPPVPPAIANACISEGRDYVVQRIARRS